MPRSTTARCGLILSLALPVAGAAANQQSGKTSPMHEEDVPVRTTVRGDGVTLELAFDPHVGGDTLAVRYRITNDGDAPLAVFDRGNRQAALARRQAAGAVAAPMFKADGADLTLRHAAMPLPSPSPTVPPVPLAARLAPGAAHEGGFEFDLALAGTPARVRWCLGVAPFDEATFQPSESDGDVPVWTASFDVVERQRALCSPWYDIAGGTFEQP